MNPSDDQAGTPDRGKDLPEPGSRAEESGVSTEQTTDATSAYSYHDDYGYDQTHPDSPQVVEQANLPAPAPAAPPPPPPTPPAIAAEDQEEEGMLRMSFMEHLQELRSRLLKALAGIGIAFACSLWFTSRLFEIVQTPFYGAMRQNGIPNPQLAITEPMEAFSIIWIKLPVVCAIFLASPWLLYQVWAFIAPGLYKRERRWAVPFVLCSAGLFIIGGLFAYFVAFRLGLGFLLGIGIGFNLQPVIRLSDYFDLFINVTLGMGIVFELPILIFFLSLLRILSPQFLMRNSRYAILLIVVVAAIVTPTPDVINLMLISVPMTVLYFGGVFASYLLWLSREGKRFPWHILLPMLLGLLLIVAGGVYLAVAKFGYRIVQSWPFLVR